MTYLLLLIPAFLELCAGYDIRPKVILPNVVVLQPGQTELELTCRAQSHTEVSLDWTVEPFLDEDCIEQSIHKPGDDVPTASQSSFFTLSSVLRLRFHTDNNTCASDLRDANATVVGGACSAQNAASRSEETFRLLTAPSPQLSLIAASAPPSSYSWWVNSVEHRRRFRRETQKALGFVVGMIPPIAIAAYVAFYLSCFRNSINQDANMFGIENV